MIILRGIYISKEDLSERKREHMGAGFFYVWVDFGHLGGYKKICVQEMTETSRLFSIIYTRSRNRPKMGRRFRFFLLIFSSLSHTL